MALVHKTTATGTSEPAAAGAAHLTCPISLELLEDPVSTPCCGNAFSRASLRGVLGAHAACPLCRADIAARFPAFDVETLPKNRTIAAMVDVHVRKLQSAAAAPETAAVAEDPPTSGDHISQLRQLHQQGLLTDAELKSALSRIPA